MKIKNIFFFLFTLFICSFSYSQIYIGEEHKLRTEINSKYDKIIDNYYDKHEEEIRNLKPENYNQNKAEIDQRYRALILKANSDKENELQLLKIRIEEENEANRIDKEREKEKNRIERERNEKIRREKMKEEQKNRMEELRVSGSSYTLIKSKIEDNFKKWLSKSDFETNEDYKKRINNNYQIELDKIVFETISKLKKQPSVSSASLSNYDIENESFEIVSLTELPKVILKIPKNFAQDFHSKFYSNRPRNGKPILVHIIDYDIIDYEWKPTRVLFIFPNTPEYNPDTYSHGINPGEYWNKSKIEVDKKGNYLLSYDWNVSLKPIRLKNVQTEFKGIKQSGVFYFEWHYNLDERMNLNFTVEDLDVEIPKLN